ncbi:MAG: MaoC family dehydratase [Woeseiaceae bacterium]
MPSVPKEELNQYVDKALDPSDWLTIDQERINSFADATLDHQFIHVDEEKAAQTPFGGTIAHGYLTLSLISHFLSECAVMPDDSVMGINYGSDKVRFLQPVPVDSEVRGRATLKEVNEKAPGQLLTKNEIVIEIKGEEKPALVAEILTMFIVQ